MFYIITICIILVGMISGLLCTLWTDHLAKNNPALDD